MRPESCEDTKKDYCGKKYPTELDSKLKNYQSDFKEQDLKSRAPVATTLPPRFANQNNVLNHLAQSRPSSRNGSTAYAVARKALEQNPVPKVAPVNFPPLRAPQSIVNVRHPFVTEARMKQLDPSTKNKIKDYHGYGCPGIQSLGSLSQYRPDSFPQPTIASVLFPDSSQFPHSPPFSTPQVGQLNQFQTFDPSSFASTQVNVNPVIPQFSAESPIAYPAQFENQFVQSNHFPTDMTGSQYQFQTAGVGQIQDSGLFIQSLQSPIAMADQYAPNYARAVRTEMIPRLRRPPRFNK